MTTQTTDAKGLQRLARKVAQALAACDDILAVCLVGSAARGDADHDSDLDLVVIAEQRHRRSELTQQLPAELQDERLSLMCFSRQGWVAEASKGSLFVHHMRLEGIPLLDPQGVLQSGFKTASEQSPNVNHELQRQVARLRLYRKPERLNGENLFALSHLYAIGKAVAIARCVDLGEPIFVKEDALAQLAAFRPDLLDDVTAVAALRPFYDLTREREPGGLPFEPVHAEEEIIRARAAIERLAYG